MTPQKLTCQKEYFSLPEEVTYLNCAYMSPLLKNAEQAGIEGLRLKRAPFDINLYHFFDQVHALRDTYASLINVKKTNRIVLMPSVSYGMGIVAKNLKLNQGENIVVSAEQFPSNVYPWKTLANENEAEIITVAPPENTSNRGETWNAMLLDAINDKTRLVAVSHTHWADGTLFNLKALREKTKEVGSLLVIDGTQSVGALPFDIQELRPDALICSSYKWLLGPYALTLGYFGEAFDNGKPIEEAWINRFDSDNFAGLVNYQDQYEAGALRYEAGGRSNFILIPILQAALNTIKRWSIPHINQYLQEITQKPIAKMEEIGCKIESAAYRSSHLFGIRLTEDFDLAKLKNILEEEKIYVSFRGSAIRVSPYVYNEQQELFKLAEVLKQSLK